MAVVTLVSGGLDSMLMAKFTDDKGVKQFPLFIDYGQINKDREYNACRSVLSKLQLPVPTKIDLSGFGKVIRTGLTDASLDVNADAFIPCRNLLFLTVGSAYAYQVGANAVSIGLLSEENKIFPDQSRKFIDHAEAVIESVVYKKINLLTPLMEFSKREVIALAKEKAISGTYSCHSGTEAGCGICISCLEVNSSTKEN